MRRCRVRHLRDSGERPDRRVGCMEMTLSRLLREPLVQFLLIGAVLFGAYRTLQPAGSANLAPQQNQAAAAPVQSALQPSRQIVLTLDQPHAARDAVSRLSGAASQRRRSSTGLVKADVKEEILYREGLALGARQGRRDRPPPHGAENAIPRRGRRGGRIGPTDAELKSLVRAERRGSSSSPRA